MEWRGPSIILSSKVYGEHALMVRVLSEEHGLYAGMVRLSKKMRAEVMAGNLMETHWSARLPEHLGSFRFEMLRPYGALVMLSAPKLDALLSALLLVGTSLPERDPHPAIYHGLLDFFASLTQSDAAGWLEHYVRLELQLLAELGFGLDLSCCAATGSAENLAYVSPRSARAVSKEAGLPYHERLLPLPAFLNQGGAPQAGDLLSGLKLTGYFLEKHLAEQRPGGLPSPRERIFAHIQRLMPGGLPLPA